MNRYKSMLNVIIALMLVFGSLGAFPARQQVSAFASDLIISEYIEGSSYNRAIELYNGTGVPVNLALYTIELYGNGSIEPSNPFKLVSEKWLGTGKTYTIVNPLASEALLAFANSVSDVTNFNGDDALVLKRGDVVVDSFGQVGFDPGVAWGSGDTSTADHTLVRKPGVCAGDKITNNAFDPSAEWTSHPVDTFSNLGSHTANCDSPAISNVTSNDPDDGATNVSIDSNVVIDFDVPVTVTEGWFTIFCATSGAHTAVVTGTSPSATYALNPNAEFGYGELCTVTIASTNVTPAMTDNHIFSFTTEPPVNNAPVAQAPLVSTPEDTDLVITLAATDVDGDTLTFAVVDDPQHGTLSGTAPNLIYTPNTNWFGTDSFTFIANDGTVDSEPATITIAVTAVNDPPVLASIGEKTVNEDILLTFYATATDVDLPAQTLTFSLTGIVPDDAAIGPSTGVFTWIPTDAGTNIFTVQVCDDTSVPLCDTEEVTITVLSDTTSIGLTAIADAYTTVKDTVLIVTPAAGVLSNDIEGYIGLLIALLDVTAANGELVLAADGSFTYIPGLGFIGEDSFTYKAFDFFEESSVTTVTITVTEKEPPFVNLYLPVIVR